jgi:hypothetical protein
MIADTHAPECRKRAYAMRIGFAFLLATFAVGSAWAQLRDAAEFQRATNKMYDMEKLADGSWDLAVRYSGPGLQYYWMIVDGLTVMDPGSETFFSNGIKTAVEVPSPGGRSPCSS